MDFTLNNLFNTSVNWLFPTKCLHCSNEDTLVELPYCENCYPLLPFQIHCCAQCGQRFAADSDYCGRCINSPPIFDRCFCPFQYKGDIKEMIQAFKYYQRPELAKRLVQLFIRELEDNCIELPELIIPTPLHISRLRERGYNQSLLLAHSLSKRLKIPISPNALIKTKKTPAQAQLSLKQRSKNLNNCFALTQTLTAKSIVIIDDVVTTGTTSNKIAKILKKNGVDYIQVWGIAHTI